MKWSQPRALVVALAVWATGPSGASTAQTVAVAAAATLPATPVPGQTRSDVVVQAVRLVVAPLQVDGRLDEEIYRTIEPASHFVQQEPHEGAPATEPTDVWVFFDERNLYVSVRCWDSHPEHQATSELRRDSLNINNEGFAVVLDTFHDHRNGFFFGTNTLGAIRDQAIIGDAANDDWNTVWDVKVQPFDGGWSAEMIVPFKSLRYQGAGPQTWGINVRRMVTWKNELSFLSKIPRSFGQAITRSLAWAATLEGVETPREAMNLEVKPYASMALTTDRAAATPFENDADRSGGLDVKYGLTRSLIGDLTINTDFAQVEEDLQQVNLTRFSLFFPEKREFFLEGQGIFGFGGIQFDNRTTTPGNVPLLFFSRRIGLSGGQTVPVRVGGRVTGKVGRLTIGAIDVQTGEKEAAGAEATNFAIGRVKWDFLRRSNVGLLVTRRSPSAGRAGTNLVIGADAAVKLFDGVDINAFVARNDTTGITRHNTSHRLRFEYTSDRLGVVAENLMVGANFTPEAGFVRRVDFAENVVQGRYSIRPGGGWHVRKLSWQANLDYITNASRTVVEDRTATGAFTIDLENSDQVLAEHEVTYELVPTDFPIAPGVAVVAGGYRYHASRLSYTLGPQRRVSGKFTAARGSFYDGTKVEAGFSGRLSAAWLPRFVLEPTVSLNHVELPSGTFDATVASTRFIITPTPRMLISALAQYNGLAHGLSSSVRLRWEYTPGSELFLVYSDGRSTVGTGVPDLLNRSIAVKITRLFRF